ncbi:unnamed protein product [Spodoptera exigua]|nr:unnamed protein product [Spodoptera exigua]
MSQTLEKLIKYAGTAPPGSWNWLFGTVGATKPIARRWSALASGGVWTPCCGDYAERPRRRLHATAARARPRCPAPPRRIPLARRTPRTPAALPPARTPHSCVQLALKRGSDPHKEPRPLWGRLRHFDYIHAFCSTPLTREKLPPHVTSAILQMSLTVINKLHTNPVLN